MANEYVVFIAASALVPVGLAHWSEVQFEYCYPAVQETHLNAKVQRPFIMSGNCANDSMQKHQKLVLKHTPK